MFVVFLLASKQMPVYSLYSFHRTFISGFEYLTPSGYNITAIIIEGFQELKNPLDYLAVTFLLSFVLDVQVSFVLP